METFWAIFWIVFWIMMFIGIALLFFYVIRILRETLVIVRTASSVSEQIQAIADLVDDMRIKARMGVFVDVLETAKRLFFKFKGDKKNKDTDY